MTRNQIREKVADIISSHYRPKSDVPLDVQQAAEEIMKLWDQGFTYEIDPKGGMRLSAEDGKRYGY